MHFFKVRDKIEIATLGVKMKYNYNKLWKLLIDNKMLKKDLMEKANIAASTMAKMSKELPVSLEVIGRICEVLKCNVGDVLEIIY